jgi:hypothetical protein
MRVESAPVTVLRTLREPRPLQTATAEIPAVRDLSQPRPVGRTAALPDEVSAVRELSQPRPIGRTAVLTPEMAPEGTAELSDQLSLSVTSRAVGTARLTAPLPATAISFAETLETPERIARRPNTLENGPKTWEDYQTIFKWVEKVTERPIAYQDQRAQQAYIESIQGKPQEAYDSKGFLASISVRGAVTYGRDDKGVHKLLSTIKYTPNSGEVSWGLRVAQKAFFWFFKSFPKTFNWIADKADKYYFTRKDMQNKSWMNIQVPQPGILPSEPLIPREQIKSVYSGTHTVKNQNFGWQTDAATLFNEHFLNAPKGELQALFEDDFHMGVPQLGHGEQHYGTWALARQLGFSDEQARRLAKACFDMDLNNTVYGNTDAFPNAMPSKHFNLNKYNPEEGDTRFIWAQKHLDAAVELAKRGRFEQAEQELGYGLHGIQDAFAHGHIRLASHAITDNIPDGVDYNPVGAYEATLATIGYLHTYLKRVTA